MLIKSVLMNESGIDVHCEGRLYVWLTQRDCLQSYRGTGMGSNIGIDL